MPDELWANPKDVLYFVDALRVSADPGETIPKPNLGSVLGSASLITLANLLNDLPGVVRREIGRFADIVTIAMIDVVDADQIVPPPDDGERRERDMATYWAAHGDVVEHGITNSGYDTYDDVRDDFADALRDGDGD